MDPEDTLKIVWVVLAVLFASAEIIVPGFFLLPFGVGAVAGGTAAFAGAPFPVQLIAFVVTSGLAFVALRPLARRLNRADDTEGVGANRLLQQLGSVTDRIGPNDPGMVRIDREDWRAEAADGTVIDVGAKVRVVEVRGTRAIVVPETPTPTNETAEAPQS